jgi:hypothetical protein
MSATSRTATVPSCLGALAMAAGAVISLGVLAGPAQAQIFQDNAIEYRFGTQFQEPANGKDITKSIANYTHVDGYKWGSNFLSVDILFSDSTDPVANGTDGAQEIYIVYRHGLSFNKISNSKNFAFGPIADIGFQLGGDANVKNDLFGSEKRLIVAGPYIAWALPKGFFNTSFNFCKEWNHNGIVGKHVEFDENFCFEAAWSVPFSLGFTTLKFNGFFNVVAPKGTDGFGAEAKTEVLTRPELVIDVGELWGRKNFIEAGFAYEYWLNKFGNDHDVVPGALAKTPMFVARAHF